jgi:hypothetical protein
VQELTNGLLARGYLIEDDRRLGPFAVDPPVVLAPMAGITNVAFRRLCREHGAGLDVCEMITSRALVERHPETLRMITFDPSERSRSLQLYGGDPATVEAAVRMVVEEDLADHVDLNFGCPVPKVTRRGGGAALPYKRRLFRGDPGARGPGHGAGRRAGHREDADRHRLRAPHVSRRGPDRRGHRRRGGCPARADGRAAILR